MQPPEIDLTTSEKKLKRGSVGQQLLVFALGTTRCGVRNVHSNCLGREACAAGTENLDAGEQSFQKRRLNAASVSPMFAVELVLWSPRNWRFLSRFGVC